MSIPWKLETFSRATEKTCEGTNFLRIFTHFAYLLFISPYRIVKHSNLRGSSHFAIKFHWLHKTICALFLVVDAIWVTYHIKKQIPNARSNADPSQYFPLCLKIINTFCIVTSMKKLWIYQSQMVQILNLLQSHRRLISDNWKISKKWTVILYCILSASTIICVLSTLGWDDKTASILEWNWNTFWNSVTKESHLVFYTSHNNTLLTWLTIVGMIRFRILSTIYDLFLLMAVMTLWLPARSFSQYLNSTVVTWETIKTHLKFLRELSTLMNNLFGGHMTMFSVHSILEYAISFNVVLFKGGRSASYDVAATICFIYFLGTTCAILLFSADVCHQMEKLKEWLASEENRMQLCTQTLVMTLNDLDSHVISVKGSNIFPVTFALVASVRKFKTKLK